MMKLNPTEETYLQEAKKTFAWMLRYCQIKPTQDGQETLYLMELENNCRKAIYCLEFLLGQQKSG